MKLPAIASLSLLLTAAVAKSEQEHAPNRIEEETFWKRLVLEVPSFSVATQYPTRSPTAAPSPHPTPEPTAPPTPEPSPKPTSPPTEEPVDCNVLVDIDCRGANGKPCDNIVAPNADCATGANISTVMFSYRVNDCNTSEHNQGTGAYCEDFFSEAIDFSGSVDVFCKDSKSTVMVVEPSTVQPGGSIIVSAPGGGSLPDEIDCIYRDSGGEMVQRNVINTSGRIQLGLKDKFGAFTLISCSKEDGEEQACLHRVGYDIDIVNIGTSDMDITAVDFTLNGETTSILDKVKTGSVGPGQVTSLGHTLEIDVCPEGSGYTYSSNINVEADPPNGGMCQDNDQYTFTVPVLDRTPLLIPPTQAPTSLPPTTFPTDQQCRVDADIHCHTTSGESCSTLNSVRGNCDGDINVITFRYEPGTCLESRSDEDDLCSDYGEISETTAGTIRCWENFWSTLNVEPFEVTPGETFTVSSNDGPLPGKIACYIFDTTGRVNQIVSFDTSKSVDLTLDRFGAMVVSACDNLSCTEEIKLTYSLTNIGTADMNITKVQSTYNSSTTSLLSQLPTNVLNPGQEIFIVESKTVGLCEEGSYSIDLVVEADPPNGMMCQADDAYPLEIIPNCIVGLEMTCNVDSNGSNCKDLVPINTQCVCEECVTNVVFRYTGANCNAPSESEPCVDGPNGGPNGVEFVHISFASNSSVLFNDVIRLNQVVVTDGGRCIGEQIYVSISDPDTGDRLQDITIDTTCTIGTNINLLDSFGSMDFVGYKCRGEDPQNCFEDVTYAVRAGNNGTVDFFIEHVSLAINGSVTSFIDDTAEDTQMLRPAESFELTEVSTIALCVESLNTATASVRGETVGSLAICAADKDLEFSLGVGTYFPTSGPSPAPASVQQDFVALSTSEPAEQCVLSVSAECILSNNTNISDGQSCETDLVIVKCLARPTAATMLYNGGDCTQSDNIQPLQSSCKDVNGGPPTQPGNTSYIVVTDIKGLGIIYFEGVVEVGAEYTLNDNGERFQADQLITIYSSNDTSAENVLQIAKYHSSCSRNLELKDRFGASQLVGFYNSVQGNVNCFATTEYTIVIAIPNDITLGESITITSVTAMTNFIGPIDLTDQVAGQAVEPGGSIAVTLEGIIDLTSRMRYTLLMEVTAVTLDGKECSGLEFAELYIGTPSPPGVPTAMPISVPAVSPAPDPLQTRCELEASISCTTASAKTIEQNRTLCEDLGIPSDSTCTEGNITQLAWLYNGIPCNRSTTTDGNFNCQTLNEGPKSPSNVFISVESKQEETVYFADAVAFGSIFTVDAVGQGLEFDDTLKITISALNGGDLLQELELRATCGGDGGDITLVTQYGALQLASFVSTAHGYQSALEEIEVTYAFSNVGTLPANVVSAVIDSSFLGERDVITLPGLELGGGESEVLRFNVLLNLYQTSGQQFLNQFDVKGTALANDMECEGAAALNFTVGS